MEWRANHIQDEGRASRGQWQAGGAGPGEADLRKSGSWRGRGEAGAGPAEADWATSWACRGRRERERALERPSRGQRGPAEAAGRSSLSIVFYNLVTRSVI